MLPWLLNFFIDSVVRGEIQSMERGVALVSDKNREWHLNQILYVNDTALVADKGSLLLSLFSEFGKIYERRKLSVNVARSKVMRITKRRMRKTLVLL
jgi:hypothetical protein